MLRSVVFALLAVLTAPLVGAETVYINDILRVGVRHTPGTTEAPFHVVTTGDKLEILERSDGYLRIRTESGVEGWVGDAYVTSEIPARVRIDGLEQAHSKLKAEHRDLKGRYQALEQGNSQLGVQLDELQQQNIQLTERLAEFTQTEDNNVWLYWTLPLIVLFLFGFFLGTRWYRQRIAQRLGGLEL